MSRRKPRTGGAGLFTFAQGGDVEPAEIRDNPGRRKCRHCHASPGEPCTRPTRRGRIPLPGYHPARTQPEETR